MGRFMTNFLKTRVVQNPKIISHKFAGKTYLIDPQRNVVRELNKTAGFIWRNASRNTTVGELIKKIVSRFDAPTDTVEEEVIKFVKKYLKAGLLETA